MTDTFYSAPILPGHDLAPPASRPSPLVAIPQNQRYAVPEDDGAHEDDGLISCVCGFADDDGNTVACDLCNRWQHTLCYYPQYEGRNLPDELQHFCVECRPQPFDAQAANTRQKLKREQQDSLLNGAKRQAPKSHKKKVKEPAGVPTAGGYTNGWPLDKARHDRNSASPRDQPPPAKRPKTSHRASEPASGVPTKGHSRKRNASNVHHHRSLSHSPDSPMDFYSPDFVRCYAEDDWTVTQVNLFSGIDVTHALSEWLRAPDDVFRDMHGHDKRDVLWRWDRELDDIPGKAQIEIQHVQDDRFQDDPTGLPAWKIVTVKEPVAKGAYIGELKGHVGFMDQYKDDTSNRWPVLRHPEPFVFFHPSLQIYIDARHEGTELRYVRRSCRPNARLQVLVTDSTDYRFCFMATEQIDPGMEVAVAWDTTDSIPRSTNTVSSKDMDLLSAWVSNVLANCGPCACYVSDCSMSRFDRRIPSLGVEDDAAQAAKLSKAKKKKTRYQVSPINTHALNSRSGSEVRRGDGEDDPADWQSASGSGGRGSASRDHTPNISYSTNGSLSAAPELSERERKKLAKEEEMFRRQDEERTGKQGKKKRSSGGSNLNTPSVTSSTSSKQLGFPGPPSKHADAGTSRPSGLPSATSTTGRRPRAASTLKTPAKPVRVTVKKPQSVEMVDAQVQCNMDQEEADQRAAACGPKRKVISVQNYLLRRCATFNAREMATRCRPAVKPAPEDDAMDVDSPSPRTSVRESAERDATSHHEPSPEVRMQDALQEDAAMTDSKNQVTEPVPAEAPTPTSPPAPSHPAADPLAPPWPSTTTSPPAPDASEAASAPPPPSHKPSGLHVQMPPPPANPFGPSLAPLSAGTPTSLTGGGATSAIQSPASLLGPPPPGSAAAAAVAGGGPVFSPAVTAAVTPSPARKKLSFSDYLKRTKAKESDAKPERDSSPASVASGPVVSSHPPSGAAAAGDATRGVAESASAVDEDARMDDAPPPPPPPPAPAAAAEVSAPKA